jgi:hypothetical protein
MTECRSARWQTANANTISWTRLPKGSGSWEPIQTIPFLTARK